MIGGALTKYRRSSRANHFAVLSIAAHYVSRPSRGNHAKSQL